MRSLDRYWRIWTSERSLAEIPALPSSYALLFVIPLLLLVTCSGSATATLPPTPTSGVIPMIEGAQTQTPRIAVRPSRTADRPSSGIPFPQFAPVATSRPNAAGRLEGVLTLVDGCLRVRQSINGTSYLVVWPPEVRLETDGGNIRIVRLDGRLVARLGDTIVLPGGGGPSVDRLGQDPGYPLREGLPEGCPGPYWTAGALGS